MRKIISLVLVIMLLVVFSFAMGCKKRKRLLRPHLRLNKKLQRQPPLRLRLLEESKRLLKLLRLRPQPQKKNSGLFLSDLLSKGQFVASNCPFLILTDFCRALFSPCPASLPILYSVHLKKIHRF